MSDICGTPDGNGHGAVEATQLETHRVVRLAARFEGVGRPAFVVRRIRRRLSNVYLPGTVDNLFHLSCLFLSKV
jgi:hypothetical protein